MKPKQKQHREAVVFMQMLNTFEVHTTQLATRIIDEPEEIRELKEKTRSHTLITDYFKNVKTISLLVSVIMCECSATECYGTHASAYARC